MEIVWGGGKSSSSRSAYQLSQTDYVLFFWFADGAFFGTDDGGYILPLYYMWADGADFGGSRFGTERLDQIPNPGASQPAAEFTWSGWGCDVEE